jgi:hypothetical protein
MEIAMPKLPKTKRKFILTITTEEDIFDKYPNFRYNYSTPDEFIAGLVADFESEGMGGDFEERFGYSVTIEPVA